MDIEEPSLYRDMKNDAIVIAYLKDEEMAKDFYRAMCNMGWVKNRTDLLEDEYVFEKLKDTHRYTWSCSWRAAGGMIADIRDHHYQTGESYMSFYCSGNEGTIAPVVQECFERMGWTPEPIS